MSAFLQWLLDLVGKFFSLTFKKGAGTVPVPPPPAPIPPPPGTKPPPPPPAPAPIPTPTKFRIMADSTNPFDIPTTVDMVAGYVDGLYKWPQAGWDRFAGKPHVRIAAIPGTWDADVADVENGDFTTAQAVEWLLYHVKRGEWRVLYFSVSRFNEIHAAVLAAGILDGQWGQWAALWDSRPILDVGSVAKQFANPATSGGHYDLSVVAPIWPGVG